VTASQRSKLILVREAISRLEDRTGKLVPINEILKDVADKGMDVYEVEDVIDKLKRTGDIFEPKRGFIQKI